MKPNQQTNTHTMHNKHTARYAAARAAENYLVELAVRKGLPIGYEERKPLITLLKYPVLECPEVLRRMTTSRALRWLKERSTLTPKGV